MKREQIVSNLWPSAVAGLAAFALWAYEPSSEHKGVADCPPGHIDQHHPLRDPKISLSKLQRGIASLRSRLTDDKLVSSTLVEKSDSGYAIATIYNKKGPSFYDLSSSRFEDGNKAFCEDPETGQRYLSPSAYLAEQALNEMGIDVSRIKVD